MIPIAKPVIETEEIENVKKVLESGFLASGSWVKTFEESFSKYLGVNDVITTVNGTAALDISLKALGIRPGDEVIVPDFTFIATANSVLFQDAKPVFADVDHKYYTLDPEDVIEKITKKTKAIICVHLFGQPCDITSFVEICEDKKLVLIEDCAQAHGAEYNNKKVGSFGVGCFSFYPTKNITTGEGGAVSTNDSNLANKLRLIINHGQVSKYLHEVLGYNLRMNNIQAAIGIAQLRKLDQLNEKRIKNAEYFNKNINNPKILKPEVRSNTKHVFHQYVLRVLGKRSDFIKYLNEKEIGNAIHYPLPLHKQPIYKELGYPKNICPTATELAEQVVSIPVHPTLSNEELEYIVNAINEW